MALVAVLFAVLAAPAAAAGGAFVPSSLLQAASEHPNDVFSVIVQGAPDLSSNHVAAQVQQQEQKGPGDENGIKRRFSSLSAVSAQLTGHQIVKLAELDGILAITPDVPLVASLADPPVNVVAPSVSGTAQQGSSLAALNGEWTGGLAPLSFAYQWLRCDTAGAACAPIAGAVSSSYAASSVDVGSTVAVTVTATGADGESASAVSLAAGPVAALPPPPPPQVVPPANVAAPTVSGVAQVGETLTAFEGVWAGSPPLSVAWQWQRCSLLGADCADVPGATGASYPLSGSDIGFTLRVVVSATDAAGSASAASPPSAPVAALPPPVQVTAPVNVQLPSVSGTAQQGVSLSAVRGSWSGGVAPLSFAYQWLHCNSAGCAAIVGASTANYVPSSADIGSTLEVTETATDSAGAAVSANSAPSAVVAPPPPPPLLLVAPPSMSGTAQVGSALTAVNGNWSGGVAPLSFAYQWSRCDGTGAACAAIAGAVSATYLASSADVGSTLVVTVTATDANGAAASAVSPPSPPVAVPQPAPPVDVDPPAVSGPPQQGVASAVAVGNWSGDAPIAYAYSWQRCDVSGAACADIAGANAATYTPVAADVGATLRVAVTASNSTGSASAVSAPTLAVAPAAPVDVVLPLLPAAPVASSSLTTTTGTWTSAAPLAYTYRWERCDETGASCADIAGATSDTYATTADEVGATLRVVVTATNAGGSTSAVSSASDRIAPQSPSGFWNWQLWPYVVHADALWSATSNASSPTPAIAVVDSGVDSSLPGLAGAVTRQVTLTSLPQGSAADGYGHGSFVAQVAAGRAPGAAGAAPRAPIVSLDVMDDNGMAMTSDVIAAADWIYTHKDAEGIRVANFSLVGSSPSSMQFDPLDKALEKLWLSGVVVVTAAGNYGVGGASTDVAYAPANDPFAITVGAADTAGTVAVADDFAAPWSVYGHTLDGFAKPDVGAPGRYIEAQVPTDSTLYRTRPDRIVAPGQLQLSGTSFAAPIVAGIAADLLAAHPDWTPDQVKGALMLSAAVPGASAPNALGVGEVDAGAAAAVAAPPNPNLALESFVVADPAGGPTPVFDAASWGTAVQADASWGTASWGTASWGTASWGTASWGTTYWSSASWGTASWGTSAAPADNAAADFRAGGAYRMHWP